MKTPTEWARESVSYCREADKEDMCGSGFRGQHGACPVAIAFIVEKAVEEARAAAVTEEREAIRSLVSTLRDHAGDDGGDPSARDACTYIRGVCDTIDAAIRHREKR
jgi:hypothetical protein